MSSVSVSAQSSVRQSKATIGKIELSERAGNFRRLTMPELLDQSAADLRYVKQIIADLANGD
jgi:hypothetical protein